MLENYRRFLADNPLPVPSGQAGTLLQWPHQPLPAAHLGSFDFDSVLWPQPAQSAQSDQAEVLTQGLQQPMTTAPWEPLTFDDGLPAQSTYPGQAEFLEQDHQQPTTMFEGPTEPGIPLLHQPASSSQAGFLTHGSQQTTTLAAPLGPNELDNNMIAYQAALAQTALLAASWPQQTTAPAAPLNPAELDFDFFAEPSEAERIRMEDTTPPNGVGRVNQVAWIAEERDLFHSAAHQWWHWKDNDILSRTASSGAALYRYFEFVFASAGYTRTYNQLKNQWCRKERAAFGRSEQRERRNGQPRDLVTSARPDAREKVADEERKRQLAEMQAEDDAEDDDEDGGGPSFAGGDGTWDSPPSSLGSAASPQHKKRRLS